MRAIFCIWFALACLSPEFCDAREAVALFPGDSSLNLPVHVEPSQFDEGHYVSISWPHGSWTNSLEPVTGQVTSINRIGSKLRVCIEDDQFYDELCLDM